MQQQSSEDLHVYSVKVSTHRGTHRLNINAYNNTDCIIKAAAKYAEENPIDVKVFRMNTIRLRGKN